jgi:dihydrofolate reductase
MAKTTAKGAHAGRREARTPRRIIAYLATSADGYIARPDGSVDWLDRPWPKGNYGMGAFLRSIDTVVYGRKTFDLGKGLGAPFMPGVRTIVVSRTLRAEDVPDAELVRGDIAGAAARWKSEPGKNIWLMGGAELFGSFLDAGALDELTVHVVPVLIGSGIPLLRAERQTTEMRLVSTRAYPDGVVRLHYALKPVLTSARARRAPRTSAR